MMLGYADVDTAVYTFKPRSPHGCVASSSCSSRVRYLACAVAVALSLMTLCGVLYLKRVTVCVQHSHAHLEWLSPIEPPGIRLPVELGNANLWSVRFALTIDIYVPAGSDGSSVLLGRVSVPEARMCARATTRFDAHLILPSPNDESAGDMAAAWAYMLTRCGPQVSVEDVRPSSARTWAADLNAMIHVIGLDVRSWVKVELPCALPSSEQVQSIVPPTLLDLREHGLPCVPSSCDCAGWTCFRALCSLTDLACEHEPYGLRCA